jgi:hypothetical protein
MRRNGDRTGRRNEEKNSENRVEAKETDDPRDYSDVGRYFLLEQQPKDVSWSKAREEMQRGGGKDIRWKRKWKDEAKLGRKRRDRGRTRDGINEMKMAGAKEPVRRGTVGE